MKLLKKFLIKDYSSVDKPAVRFRYGVVAGLIGVLSNVVLFIAKLVIGLLGKSITIMADAINNLSDAGSSIVTVLGFKLSSRPADKEHPYGHARYEYITALIVAFVVLAIGILLGKASVEKIIAPVTVSITVWTYVVLGLSVIMKLGQMLMYIDFGKAINSEALKASSVDSRNDIITTVAVLIATVIMDIFKVNIDGYFGCAVSLFIIITSLKLIKETIDPILGTVPDNGLVTKIKEKLTSYDGVLGIHDLMIHNYGATECFILVHVEVDSRRDIMLSHELMDTIERDFATEMGLHLCIHMDPIQVDDPLVDELHEKIKTAIKALDGQLNIHDFRVVKGATHTNILFDVVIPFDNATTLENVQAVCDSALNGEEMQYFFVIGVDKSYV